MRRPDVSQLNLPFAAFLDPAHAAAGRCLYLQHPLLRPAGAGAAEAAPHSPPPPPAAHRHGYGAPSTTPPEYRTQCGFSPVGGAVGVPTLAPTPRLGAAMAADLSSLRLARLRALEAAARVGAWTVCQLFVGSAATGGARTRLHSLEAEHVFFVSLLAPERTRTQRGSPYSYPPRPHAVL